MWFFWSTLIPSIFIAFVTINLLMVTLSYSMCWYEYANADPQLLDKRFRCRTVRMIFSVITQETFFNILTLLVVPFGLLNPRKHPQLRGETPILLLHGLFNNRASWFWFKWSLRKQGFNNIATINLSAWHNEEALTELVAKKVDELRHRLGVNKVHLICHSMGGIIGRNYIQLRGGADKVDRCICLGAPHLGSKLTPFALSPLSRVLVPGSDFLRRLNAAPIPEEVKMTNIFTRKDNMVLPNSNAQLPWGDAVELDNMGHTALIYRRPALVAVCAALQKQETT
ncbi:MAG: alpha/beta fold hydrolase [Deltaproteobacteria bacterium]|nr:alpha/beta fold hydrolase [Deltaproteobacteria bacterium]